MALVEEGCDFVSLLEACDARADLFDDSGSVRAGDNALLDGEGVFALGGAVRRENALSRGGVGARALVPSTYLGDG